MVKKIDLHTHIIPKDLPDWAKKYGYGDFIKLKHHIPCCAEMWLGDRMFREIKENAWNPEVRIKECHQSGVAMQVLSTIPIMFNYWAKPHDTLDIARFLNDHIASIVRDYPKSFLGLGTIPMQNTDLAIQELERCVNDLHLQGVQIGSNINDLNLDEAQFTPFFEAAEKIGASIFVHPWNMMGKEKMPRYWLPWLVGMPAETSRAICSMIFGGIFERYPKLKIAFAHGGGSFPATIGRIEHGFQVRPDLCATQNHINPRHYLGKFYVDSLVHDTSMLKYLVELLGADKIMLGSDYPFPLGEKIPGELIEKTNLDQSIKNKILRENVLAFLGLESD